MLENLQVILYGTMLIFFNIALLIIPYIVIKEFVYELIHYYKFRTDSETLFCTFLLMLIILIGIFIYILFVIEIYKNHTGC